MKSCLGAVVAVVASVLVACGGGDEQCAGCSAEEEASVTVSALRRAEDPASASGLITSYYPVTLELWNSFSSERICQFTYSYRDWSMQIVSGTLASSEPIPANGWRTVTVNVPLNQTVSINAACWQQGWPEVGVRGGNSVTTVPMKDSMTCRAIYSEDANGASMSIPCWET